MMCQIKLGNMSPICSKREILIWRMPLCMEWQITVEVKESIPFSNTPMQSRRSKSILYGILWTAARRKMNIDEDIIIIRDVQSNFSVPQYSNLDKDIQKDVLDAVCTADNVRTTKDIIKIFAIPQYDKGDMDLQNTVCEGTVEKANAGMREGCT